MAGFTTDQTILDSKAFVISGIRLDSFQEKAMVGVLFAPNPPDMKALKNMGFLPKRNLSVDIVLAEGGMPADPTLYLFERTPCAGEVVVASVSISGRLSNMKKMRGEPHAIIPEVKGAAAERYIKPRNGLGMADFPKPSGLQYTVRQRKVLGS